jgi:dimethylargininase
VLLGDDRVLMAGDCPESAAMFRGLGYEPIEVDIGEFQKLEGCVTCLSVRLRTLPPAGLGGP